MSRLIDADKLLEVLNKKSVPFNANVNDAILNAPTVDAVEVVRCENCRHDNNCEIQYAAQAGSKFFCAYGERKKNEWLKRTAPTAERE